MNITYTLTDESPALATYSFLPIVEAFLKKANINIKKADISLSARIISAFNDYLNDDQKLNDDLAMLDNLVKDKDANLIKTPNISASIPQLKAAIKELQDKGYNIPNFPDTPKNDKEKEIKLKYQNILGSAVNPILRQGNSDRRCSKAVKNYAKSHPYKIVDFDKNSKTKISFMQDGDFFSNEKAILIQNDTNAKIRFISNDNITILKEIKLEKNELIDASFMSIEKLDQFYEEQIKLCQKEDILFSLHLKATMMKISEPVIFGRAVKIFFKSLFEEFKDEFKVLNINENNGIAELLDKIQISNKKDEIIQKYEKIINSIPISMVDSSKKISNLHVPSDVIVDASMPAMFKNGAKLWDKDNSTKDTNAIIPDKTYAVVYEAVLEDLHKNGTLNPSILGSVANVGLMAKKAQEYGSHDKTFIAKENGRFEIVDENNNVLISHEVKTNDIYRINEVKFDAIINWIDLGIQRSDTSDCYPIFWLDENRASDNIMIKLVKNRLKEKNKDIEILSPKKACLKTFELIRKGKDVISITGNVLRDYLTDLFPILELGTSAKMLSIVPMLNGGAMFETGAGGSAPKQVNQLIEENHLRWDSLGEFLALQASLEFLAQKTSNFKANILSKALDEAIEEWLENDKAPSRKVKEYDNRTSHFYLAFYWAKHLSKQSNSLELQTFFKEIYEFFVSKEKIIIDEFINTQGNKVDLGGYYKFDEAKVASIMRPSKNFNDIIKAIEQK